MNKSNRKKLFSNIEDAIILAILTFVIALSLQMAFSHIVTDKTVDTSSVVETTNSESTIISETFESEEIPLSDGIINTEFISNEKTQCSTMNVSNPFTVSDEFSESSDVISSNESTEESSRESIEDIPSAELIGETVEEPITLPEYDLSEVPLDPHLIDIIVNECNDHNVPIPIALAVINTESNFTDGLWSSANCYGLMQLHADYFPNIYTPEDNLKTGIEFLGSLIDKHGNIYIALNVYANGHCTFDFSHQYYVMSYAEEWSAKTGAPI